MRFSFKVKNKTLSGLPALYVTPIKAFTLLYINSKCFYEEKKNVFFLHFVCLCFFLFLSRLWSFIKIRRYCLLLLIEKI